MAVPSRPVTGGPVATDWGDVVHDSAVAMQTLSGGPVSVTTPATSYGGGWSAVVFTPAFASTPQVSAVNGSGSAVLAAFVRNITPNGMDVGVTRIDGNAGVATGAVYWTAHGPRA